MSEWMKEMERLVDSYGDMRAKAAEPLRVQKPYCSWIDGVATARAALLAHAAQRDHVEDTLDMVPTSDEVMKQAVRDAQEPMFWVRLCSNGMYEGPLHNSAIEQIRKDSGAWSPLYLGTPTANGRADAPVELPEPDCMYITADGSPLKSYMPHTLRDYGDAREAAGYARGLVEAQRPVSTTEVPMPEHVEQLAITRYRPVPNGMFGYKVVAGDGTRSVFEGTKSECTLIARKLTEAFLDGAHVAGDAREAAGYARGRDEAEKLREALRFYARGEHYMLDEADEFDTVSGEPDNLLFSGRDGCSTMVEDGSIAKAALAGEAKP